MFSRRIILFTILFLLLSSGGGYSSASTEIKRVLVLYSADKGLPAHELTDTAIRSAVKSQHKFDIQLFTDYLDLVRFDNHRYKQELARYLGEKYSDARPDVIIVVGSPALEVALSKSILPFSEVPIVVNAIFDDDIEAIERADVPHRITAVYLKGDIDNLVNTARRFKPSTRQLVLVGGASEPDMQLYSALRKSLKRYKPDMTLIELSGLAMPQLLERVVNLPGDSIILYSTVFMDGAGRRFAPRDVLKEISRSANVPVFGIFDSYLGYGIVGGPLLSFEAQGNKSVDLAIRVLSGESPGDIPFEAEEPLTYKFDWRELERWGIDESALPAGSIVLYKPFSVWDEYKLFILGTLIFIVLESSLIAVLITQRRRKSIAEQSLKDAEEKYRRIFEGALEGIFETSPQGESLTANPALARMLGYDSPDDVTSAIRYSTSQLWVNPDERVEFIRQLEKDGVIRTFECQFRRKDGTNIWVSMSCRKVPGPDGQTFYSGFIEDITGRKLTESETRKLREDLAHVTRVSTLGEFTSSLAHELNQPLAAILSSAQAALRFLQSDTHDPHLFRTILQNIVQDDKRAAGVITSLRAMVKREITEKMPLDLNSIVQEVLSLVRGEAITRDVEIQTDFDVRCPWQR